MEIPKRKLFAYYEQGEGFGVERPDDWLDEVDMIETNIKNLERKIAAHENAMRRLEWAKGSHERLGGQSPHSLLPPDIIEMIGCCLL